MPIREPNTPEGVRTDIVNVDLSRNDSAIEMAFPEASPNVRLLVLDIDGTIVDGSNRMRDSVVDAIQSARRRGVEVTIATGRMNQTSLSVYESLGLTLPLICFEGALIRQPGNGFVHRHWPIGSRVAARLLDYSEGLSASDGVSIHFCVQDDVYVSHRNDASIEYFAGSAVEPVVVKDLRQVLSLEITKAIVVSEDEQAIARLCRQLKDSPSRVEMKKYKSVTFLEVFDPSANKRLAVSHLAEQIMSLRSENVMAIGDDATDIEMLRYAGIGVSMGNAPITVKESADWVTSTVEKDGVALAVERFILRAGN